MVPNNYFNLSGAFKVKDKILLCNTDTIIMSVFTVDSHHLVLESYEWTF